MRKSWIKTKKDWYIAFIFTILVTYVLSDFIWKISVGILTGLSLKEFIMLFFPDKITYASYPATYGNLFVTAVVVTLVSVIVLCRHHAKLKKVLAAAGTGAIVSLGVLAAFHMHCRLIVGTGADNSVFSGDIIARGKRTRVDIFRA